MIEKKTRRSLTHVGGEVSTSGDRDAAAALAHAFDVAPAGERENEPERAHVHGFHAYPARMHPTTAARLIEAFTKKGERVLDPFCGSGTVLVEAMIAGRMALGVDLNPFAVELARLKTQPLDEKSRAAIHAAAEAIAQVSDERRKKRAGATRRLHRDDVAAFDPHVLLELDSIHACLTGRLEGGPKIDEATSRRLLLVLSAILTKVSKRRGDTSDSLDTKRIAAGYTTKLFVKKARDLDERLHALAGKLDAEYKRPRIVAGDAMELPGIVDDSIDAIITSPPYAGTYDYLAHHEMRLRWLGLKSAGLEAQEMGARRAYAPLDADAARRRYAKELGSLFESLARVAKKDARLILLMADSATRTTALHADAFVQDVAHAHGAFRPVARASQLRPHFHGPSSAAYKERPRAEHLLLLSRI